MILIAPARFGLPADAARPLSLPAWGIVYLLAGAGLLATATLVPPRWLTVGAHQTAGVALVVLAAALASGGSLRGPVVYGALGLGTLLAPFRLGRRFEHADRGDWLALVVAATSLALGGLFLARPDLALGPALAPAGVPARAFGLAFLGGGAALLFVQVRPAPRAVVRAGHLAAGVAYGAFALLISLPSGALTGLMYYGGIGIAIALLPWLAPRLPRPETSGLRTRVALVLIALACVPLILAETVSANRAESIALAQVSTDLQVRAAAQSQSLGDFARLHLAAVSTVATRVDWASLPPDRQRALLQSLVASDVSVFATFDAAGRPLARSDDLPLAPLDPGLIEAIRRGGGPALLVADSTPDRPPVVVFGAPWAGKAGPPAGYVTAEVGGPALAAALAQFDPQARTGATVFLVDAAGRLIARAGPAAEDAPGPAVAAARAGGGPGALRYPTPAGDQLAGYARVPATGWGIVVERPVAGVLASSRAERDLTFGFLLVACVAAVAVGILAADRLVAPLRTLADAADRLAEGDATAPLPRSDIGEVARLASGFDRMRAQLAARAAEREAVLAREQAAHAQAEAAVRLRDDFLSIAAHELKTPITGLRMGVQALLRYSERGVPADSPQLRAALQTIDGQSTRLTRMVVQLLEVSRFQLGRFALQRGAVNLSDLLAGVVQQFQAQTARHTLVLSAPAEAWADVDGLRVEQVVANLLDNAVKYSPDGGQIDVTLELTGPEQVRLTVRDRGLGIPPERRSRIFDLFYQAHVDSHQSGMGIGLYLVRQIVELHGGRVAVAFPADGGTSFRVDLPVGSIEAAPPQNAVGSSS